MQYIGSVLAQIWRLFSIPWPGTGLTCAQVILGIFVVGFSISIIQSLLSLAGIISGSSVNAAKGLRKSLRAKGSNDKNGSYSHAKKNKDKKDE